MLAVLLALLAGGPDATPKQLHPMPAPTMLCGLTCYCVEVTKPRACFCAQPKPEDGTIIIMTPDLIVYTTDGGIAQVKP